ncbi:hypothetical protein [Kutzneria buriramensis]|nr:hypothetical protein [Kutzneria buriramensis]
MTIRPTCCSPPNLVLLPHVGSATEATRVAMVDLAARDVIACSTVVSR